MTNINKHQFGFAHVQLLAVLAIVVLAAGLTFWRINKTGINSHLLEGTELTETEIIEQAEKANFVDKDHDLVPLCNETFSTECESEKEDADFDNDGTEDSKDDDDDNDSIKDSDDNDDDNDEVEDEQEDDEDNDGIDDDEDSDDDNDGEEDDHENEDSHVDEDKNDGSSNEDSHADEDQKDEDDD